MRQLTLLELTDAMQAHNVMELDTALHMDGVKVTQDVELLQLQHQHHICFVESMRQLTLLDLTDAVQAHNVMELDNALHMDGAKVSQDVELLQQPNQEVLTSELSILMVLLTIMVLKLILTFNDLMEVLPPPSTLVSRICKA